MITACVLTISDRGARGQRQDLSGPAIEEALRRIDGAVTHYEVVPDDRALIREKLVHYSGSVDLILTTGGRGLSPRDVTPEATLEVVERQVPGIAETMRMEGLGKTRRSMLSRAVAGVRGGTLIINLPGSPSAVAENLEAVLEVIPHAVEKIKGSDKECAR